MRELLISCLVLLAAVSSVQSSAIYRKYREIEIPVEEIRVQDPAQEVVSELRKEVIPVEVDIVEPIVLVKEEVIVPVESVKNLESQIDPEIAPPSLNEIIAKSAPSELPLENALEEKIEEQKTGTDAPQELIEDENPSGNMNEENVLPGLRQNSNTTVRPTLLQQAQQIISNNPIGQFIDSIRRPLTSTAAPGDETSTNPNILQQLQQSVQSFGSQITNALIPNQNLDASTQRPPNIFENLQSNFQNVVGSVFRPQVETNTGTNPTPVGPIQGVISNIQSFFTGNRGTEQIQQSDSTATSTDSNKPIDDKIQVVRNSEEVKDSSENAEQEIVVGEDSSE